MFIRESKLISPTVQEEVFIFKITVQRWYSQWDNEMTYRRIHRTTHLTQLDYVLLSLVTYYCVPKIRINCLVPWLLCIFTSLSILMEPAITIDVQPHTYHYDIYEHHSTWLIKQKKENKHRFGLFIKYWSSYQSNFKFDWTWYNYDQTLSLTYHKNHRYKYISGPNLCVQKKSFQILNLLRSSSFKLLLCSKNLDSIQC